MVHTVFMFSARIYSYFYHLLFLLHRLAALVMSTSSYQSAIHQGICHLGGQFVVVTVYQSLPSPTSSSSAPHLQSCCQPSLCPLFVLLSTIMSVYLLYCPPNVSLQLKSTAFPPVHQPAILFTSLFSNLAFGLSSIQHVTSPAMSSGFPVHLLATSLSSCHAVHQPVYPHLCSAAYPPVYEPVLLFQLVLQSINRYCLAFSYPGQQPIILSWYSERFCKELKSQDFALKPVSEPHPSKSLFINNSAGDEDIPPCCTHVHTVTYLLKI